MKGIMTGEILIIIGSLIFAIILLAFFWGFIQKGVSTLIEGVRIVITGLLKWFCDTVVRKVVPLVPFC
ncbi:MAG: hypothetical protein ACP5O8_02060 [Candidatus Aenigmatarchaeota archaeon]